jgi:ABC-type bacteriocin/lantibiotic exporter with double-glycine peptidase domain
LAATGATVVRLALMWVSQKFIYGLQQDLSMAVFARALRQPYIHYLRRNSSELISSQQKIATVVGGILTPVIQAMSAAVMAFTMTVFLFLLNPGAAFIAAASIALTYLAISLYARHKSKTLADGLSAVHAARIQMIQETLGGIRDINLDQSQAVFEARLLKIEDGYRRMVNVATLVSSAPRLLIEGVAIILVAVMAAWFSRQQGGVLAALPVLGALALGAQRMLPMIQVIYLGYSQYSLYSGNIKDLVILPSLMLASTMAKGAMR